MSLKSQIAALRRELEPPTPERLAEARRMNEACPGFGDFWLETGAGLLDWLGLALGEKP